MRRFAWMAFAIAGGISACLSLDGFTGGSDAGTPNDGGGSVLEATVLPIVDAAPDVAIADAGASCGVVGPTDGLIAYYPFDETTGATSADCSDHQLTGNFVRQLADGGSRAPGVHGGAIHVAAAGKTGCVDLGLASSLQVDPFSVAVWLKVDSFPDTRGTGATGYVIGQAVNAAFDGWRIGSAGISGGGAIQWQQGSDDGGTNTSRNWPGDGAWHHYAITVEPTAVSVYLDGVAQAPAGPSFPINFTVVAARIGCRADDGNYFDGLIDDLRFYGRVLTTTEIAGLARP